MNTPKTNITLPTNDGWIPLSRIWKALHHPNFYWGSLGGFSDCKYLELRIDTRDNCATVKDRNSKPVDFDALEKKLEKPDFMEGMNRQPDVPEPPETVRLIECDQCGQTYLQHITTDEDRQELHALFQEPEVRESMDKLHQSMKLRGWKTMESAPTDGTVFLVYTPHSAGGFQYVCTRNTRGQWACMMSGDVLVDQPTHWQPLPTPPQD